MFLLINANWATWAAFYPLVPAVVMLLIVLRWPHAGLRWFCAAERAIARLAQRRGLAIVVVGLVALLLSAAMLLIRKPYPVVHDEFSYLLASDTFAQGRLTNPAHPLWMHFESYHIIQQPTYASKYPPAQGLILALGQVLTGYPIVGIWLSTMLACAAVCWMLQAWLPLRWALAGGLLLAFHPMVLEWSQNYWGGTLAMGGGALVLGAFRRMMDGLRARDGWLMGIGLAVLANSRPFEGAILGSIVLAYLLGRLLKKDAPRWRVWLRCFVLPVLLVLIPAVAAMAYYNLRVTGNPLRMPYMIHEETYAVAPPFIWQRQHPEPTYRHPEMRGLFVDSALVPYQVQRTLSGFFIANYVKLHILASACFSQFVLLFALAPLLWVAKNNGWMRRAQFIVLLFCLPLLFETWMQPHYAAPIVGLMLVLLVQALRHLRIIRWRGRPVGRFIARASVALSLLSLLNLAFTLKQHEQHEWRWAAQRAEIASKLQQDAARHLIIVPPNLKRPAVEGWVYNEANIDAAKIVWAHEMDETRNRELLRYFKDRQSWLLKLDTEPPTLVPYPLSAE